MATSDSDRLLGAGVPLTITNGVEERTVRLRYTMRSLKTLEDAFGSLDGAMDALGTMGNPGAKRIGVIATFLAAGLVHEGFTEDSILDWIDLSRATDDMGAAAEALSQSLPRPTEGSSPNANGERRESPGNSSTVSPPSSSGAAIGSSGTK